MKKNRVVAVAAVALLGALSANAAVIFNDTFDTTLASGGVWNDLNSNDLAARQAAGTTGSTYTLGVGAQAQTLIGPAAGTGTMPQPLLIRSHFDGTSGGTTTVDLDTDFGSSLAGGQWTFSYDGRVAGTAANGGWAGFAIGNPADTPNGGGTALGINIFQSGGVAVWSYGSIQANPNIPTPATQDYTIDVDVDEVAGTIHATFTDASNPGGHDLGTYNITFADGGRFFEFKNSASTTVTSDGFVDFRVDNVMIETIPEPATLGLMALLGGGILWVRKRF